jgi:hypothetical protein
MFIPNIVAPIFLYLFIFISFGDIQDRTGMKELEVPFINQLYYIPFIDNIIMYNISCSITIVELYLSGVKIFDI